MSLISWLAGENFIRRGFKDSAFIGFLGGGGLGACGLDFGFVEAALSAADGVCCLDCRDRRGGEIGRLLDWIGFEAPFALLKVFEGFGIEVCVLELVPSCPFFVAGELVAGSS